MSSSSSISMYSSKSRSLSLPAGGVVELEEEATGIGEVSCYCCF